MENKAKPLICEILGVEVGEQFMLKGISTVFSVSDDGTVHDKTGKSVGGLTICYAINNSESVKKLRHWTPEEVELAKAINLVWEKAHRLRHGFNLHKGWIFIEEEDGSKLCMTMEADRFPSLKPGEAVPLSDIIGEEHGAAQV